jgi:FKBP-type peptidyl-prolyl cis-trans isomerase
MWTLHRVFRRPVIAAAIFGTALCLGGCDKKAEPEAGPRKAAPEKDEFKSEDLVVGKGAEAKTGSTVKVHYDGTLKNGTKFDSSHDRGEPFEFTIGKGGVIMGWDKGVPGMKVGGKRRLTIPAELGYGSQGQPPKIPGGATLVFLIELLEVK